MTFDEAKNILASVAVLDNRTVDGVTIQLWQSILDPFTESECMWALREFSRDNSRDYLRPAHLVDIIRSKREQHAEMNPGRESRNPDAWLQFEGAIEAARRETKAIREQGVRSAVEAMEDDDGGV